MGYLIPDIYIYIERERYIYIYRDKGVQGNAITNSSGPCITSVLERRVRSTSQIQTVVLQVKNGSTSSSAEPGKDRPEPL